MSDFKAVLRGDKGMGRVMGCYWLLRVIWGVIWVMWVWGDMRGYEEWR